MINITYLISKAEWFTKICSSITYRVFIAKKILPSCCMDSPVFLKIHWFKHICRIPIKKSKTIKNCSSSSGKFAILIRWSTHTPLLQDRIFIYKIFICTSWQKFLYYVLKSSDVLDVLVPILFHLNDSRADQCKFWLWISTALENANPKFCFLLARVGLMHIGVFILLLLSGERNFGVRLNKPYTATVPMDIPVFTGKDKVWRV